MVSNKGKIAKACKEMKMLYGMPELKVKAALKRLLRLYGNEWGLIEENNYRVLFDCTVEDKQEDDKKSELMVVEVLSDDEPEDLEPLLWRGSRNHNEQIKRSSKWIQQDEAPREVVRTELSVSKRAKTTSSCEIAREIEEKKPVIVEISDRRKLGIDNNGTGIAAQKNMLDVSQHFSHKTFQEELSLAVIQPDSTQLEVQPDNGKMKVSLIFNSSIKYYAKIPSLDAVLKVVEDNFSKKYGIIDPDFSVKKLMMELCKCVLAVNTDSSDELHLLPTIDTSKKSDAEIHTDRFVHHQINSNNQPSHSHLSVGSNETPNGAKDPIFVEDITRGEERQPISLLNHNGVLELPKFFYISKNIVYNTAYVNFSLARISDHNCCSNCSGNCLSAPENCACTSETRGDFAYTTSGLVEEKFLTECIAMSRRKVSKEHLFYCKNCPLENSLGKSPKHRKRKRAVKPCKGHLMRKFIKECWAKCECSRYCGNRVVQRGITVKLQVFQTRQGKGWGLRTLQELEKGTFVCEYVGEIVTNEELHERNEESAGEEHTYPVLLDADWASERHLKDEEALCLDATKFGNVARFINHRCYDATLVEIPVEVETPDHHYYHIAFFTTRKVEMNEELTWDYGIDFDDESHPIKAFKCKCGSFFCRMKKKNRS